MYFFVLLVPDRHLTLRTRLISPPISDVRVLKDHVVLV